MLDEDIVKAAGRLLDICKRKNLLIATAESCTAGLVAGTLTEVPGTSSILDRGFITLFERGQARNAWRLARHSCQTWRGQPRNRRGHGDRRARSFARASGGVGDRYCGTRWRQRSKAGWVGAFRGGLAQRQTGACRKAVPAMSGGRKCASCRCCRPLHMLHEMAEGQGAYPPRQSIY